jgi:hypothetical protein
MLRPLIERPRRNPALRSRERGVTMALVALSIFSIIAMAGLAVDLGTLYEASAEAQRAADAGALAAARMISITGVTGDPTNHFSHWLAVCGGSSSPASAAAVVVVQQNKVGGAIVPKTGITVSYLTQGGGATNQDCSGLTAAFGVNPIVMVQVQQTNLPTYFSRIWGRTGSSVSATAVAEAYDPSGSATYSSSGNLIPVQPRCVKPWIIPNRDPDSTSTINTFVSVTDGSITNPGVYQSDGGVIGESFNMNADCKPGAGNCEFPLVSAGGNMYDNPPQWSAGLPGILEYVPALIQGNAIAVPSCASSTGYQAAVAGCDQTTAYTCGTPSTTAGATQVDLTENPVTPTGAGGDTTTAALCLINNSTGRDTINPGTTTTPVFPFQIQAGSGNPLVKAGVVNSNDVITSSNSIVTIPIADFGGVAMTTFQPPVTIVGFLQVFVNGIDTNGNMNVTVMNVSGCSNSATSTPVNGTSPVPVRLITPP